MEIVPKRDTSHIEEGLGSAISGDAGQATKNEHIHDGGKDWLDEIPQRAQDGLLINGDDITLDIHAVKIAITPNTLEVNVKKASFGLDFNGPIFHKYILTKKVNTQKCTVNLMLTRTGCASRRNQAKSKIKSKKISGTSR